MTAKEEPMIYSFEEGKAEMKELLGGKGSALAEMTRLGLSVPPGFTLTTEACNEYYRRGRQLPQDLREGMNEDLRRLEQEMGRKFGDEENPLLLSVRSGAAVSMPGMMDTILNLGLNDETVEGLAATTGDRRFALDCYRRFIQMFANVAKGWDIDEFESILDREKRKAAVEYDVELGEDSLQRVVRNYKKLYREKSGERFPQDPLEQLISAVEAVFDSWNNSRAKVYRRLHNIPDDLGTAVNVQVMVFGNMGKESGTGVVFTRNPSTGENELYGEYLVNAQGEDVVAGIRTPKSIEVLQDELPGVYDKLSEACEILEKHYKDMQDIEFTVESGKLYLLQTRTGKRTAKAAVKIAYDLVQEGIIDQEEALLRVDPNQIARLLHRNVDPQVDDKPLAGGLPASPGAALGRVVFGADEAERLGETGEHVILVRPETTPDDIHGIAESQGILTSRGGMTCHAAIVARGMGKPCVCGCGDLEIDLHQKRVSIDDVTIEEGDYISIDGSTGEVYLGRVSLVEPDLTEEFNEILSWADKVREM